MYRLLRATFTTVSFAASLWAQTTSELERKYRHHEVYEVQPGVQMTARFTSAGLVCEMRVEKSHFGKDKVDLSDDIDKDRINSLLNEIVPTSERGIEDKKDPQNGTVLGLGQITEEIHSYSNVRVHVLWGEWTSVAYVHWRHRKCAEVAGPGDLPSHTLANERRHFGEDDNIREVVFRHLMDHNLYSKRGESFDGYYLSLGYRKSRKGPDPSDLFKGTLIDPPNVFMRRFGDRKNVRKASLSHEKALDQLRDRRTGKPGMLLSVTDISWLSETEVKVKAGYHLANLGSAEFTYVLKMEAGVWKVASQHMDSIAKALHDKSRLNC